jgi:chloride channel protein, CIC family
VSCVTATIIARVLSPAHPGYEIPEYALLAPREVLVGLAMAPILGVFSVLYVRVVSWVEVAFYRVPRRTARFLPPIGMAIVGASAIMFPQLLGNGYDTVNAALLGQIPVPPLIALPFLKLAATALCAGVGIPGGLFTPSLFYGALLGGALGRGRAAPRPLDRRAVGRVRAHRHGRRARRDDARGGLVGAHHLRAHRRLRRHPAAHAVRGGVRGDEPHDRARLALHGAAAPPRREAARAAAAGVAAGDPISGLMSRDAETVPPGLPFQEVILKLLSLPRGSDLYVTDPEGRSSGVLVLDALKGTIPDGGDLAMIVAADVMDSTLPPVTPTMTVSEVAAHFEETDLERLPVVDDRGRLVGTVAMRDLVAHGSF